MDLPNKNFRTGKNCIIEAYFKKKIILKSAILLLEKTAHTKFMTLYKSPYLSPKNGPILSLLLYRYKRLNEKIFWRGLKNPTTFPLIKNCSQKRSMNLMLNKEKLLRNILSMPSLYKQPLV